MNSKINKFEEELENPNKENEGPIENNLLHTNQTIPRQPLQDITDLIYPRKKKLNPTTYMTTLQLR